MIPKQFKDIEKGDIGGLVENAIREGRSIEYKQQLPGGQDSDKKELLADVSSFANASGGDILFGIDEERDGNGKPTGIPRAANGLGGINVDQEIQRLENSIRSGIEPRIPGLQIRPIDGFQNGPVIIIPVPKSWASPHMVTYKISLRFWSRTSNGKAPLSVPEIRAAFIQSETLPEQIRRFREERLGNILAGEASMPLQQGPALVLHIVPVGMLAERKSIDVLSFHHDGTLLILLAIRLVTLVI
jgi:hypothetical protein